MKKHLCTLAAATLLTMTLGGSHALAAVLFGENEKNYAGSSCQPATSVDGDRVRYLTGTARNTSTSAALFLECPIIKDEYSSKVNSGLVVVVDRRTDDNVSCVFRSLRALDGAALTTVAVRTVATSEPGPAALLRSPWSAHRAGGSPSSATQHLDFEP